MEPKEGCRDRTFGECMGVKVESLYMDKLNTCCLTERLAVWVKPFTYWVLDYQLNTSISLRDLIETVYKITSTSFPAVPLRELPNQEKESC